jgi:hypothetical protein
VGQISLIGLYFHKYLKMWLYFFLSIIIHNVFFNLCGSDSCILQFLNELNLTYQRLTGFVVSFDFIPIVLVPWDRFPLCHTPIRPISAFQDQILILVRLHTTWSRGSHHYIPSYKNNYLINLSTSIIYNLVRFLNNFIKT